MPDFSDIPGALYDARMQNLQNRFNDVTGMFEDPYETMRRRMGLPTQGNTRPVVQTIKTNPETGEQEMTIKGDPRDLSAANPNTPTVSQPGGYMNLANSASNRPVAYQPAAPAVPTAPATPAPVAPDNYNTRIAQMETGGNTRMGYHNPALSSAYGPYGITRAAYSDIQAANPEFANRPITSLNPQEQTQAMETYTKKNAEYLNNYGIEPTAGNLAAAHFLGAKGYSDYLKTGRISPEAAAANGGEERVRQIVEQRRSIGQQPAVAGPVQPGQPGQPQMVRTVAPAGGAQPTPAPTWQDTLSTIQNDPTKLAAFIGDEKNSAESRAVAGELLKREYQKKDEADKAGRTAMLALQGDPQAQNELVRDLRNKEGSYLKAYLFSRLGLNDLAREEQQKLGAGVTMGKVQLGNQSYAVETDGRGAVTRAWDVAGKPVDDATLAKINASGVKAGSHRYSFTGETGIDPITKEEVRQRQDAISGNVEYVYATGPKAGEVYRGSTPVAKSVQTQAAKMDYGLITDLRKKFGNDAIAAMTKFQEINGPFTNETERSRFLQLYGFGSATPTSNLPVPPQLPGGIPSAPVPAAPAGPDAVQQSQMNDAELQRQNMKRVPGAPGAVAPTPVQAAPAQPGAAPATTPAPAERDLTKPIAVSAQELEAQKKIRESQARNAQQAKGVFPFVTQIRDLVDKSTSSGVGSLVDKAGNFVGYSTSGADAIAAIGPLADKVLKSVERFEGPQSDLDVKSYKEAAGKLADPTVPASQKQAAFDTIIEIMKRNAPDLDWSQYERKDKQKTTGAAKPGSTKTINGVTYEFDGRGWKKVSGT